MSIRPKPSPSATTTASCPVHCRRDLSPNHCEPTTPPPSFRSTLAADQSSRRDPCLGLIDPHLPEITDAQFSSPCSIPHCPGRILPCPLPPCHHRVEPVLIHGVVRQSGRSSLAAPPI
ncbi:hypothetical protein M0R45_035813 [Rubus argutus]|uniref:Uncharacterized protein n=1 Tax=Rubus argutus TaxID=59490 RepID=A0AAW1VYI9_RUBAR